MTDARQSPRRPSRIAVLASGGGSNLQALIEHFAQAGRHAGAIVWVGSDRPDAGALEKARAAGIATDVVSAPHDADALLAQLEAVDASLLVLAGYLKLVPASVVRAFHGRLLNVHPALLPAFGGPGMFGKRIHEAVIAHGATITGVTVHFVDEHFDRGPILAQWPVPVLPGDTPHTLAARVLRIEHRLLPVCVSAVATGALMLGDDLRVHGHLGFPMTLASPHWRFSLTPDATDDGMAFALDAARLFPR
jgi:formyltetrahydrofolate-dependent phosphoribosylglycinamide formyltransferase